MCMVCNTCIYVYSITHVYASDVLHLMSECALICHTYIHTYIAPIGTPKM